ncbi:uncharacterized protein LOC143363236 [Halictus rubicundus]|uniref:uncharacterized protein LOC143363236 n=1 Tax=Halictus rubicundus TaxID=77578 RepID=UPI0040359749
MGNCRNSGTKSTGPLSTIELREALLCVLRISQRSTYPLEMDSLTRGDYDILQVGDRLHLSSLSEPHRHPAIVDRSTHLATLIIQEAHQKTLHGGFTATLAWIHGAFWIPRIRARAKKLLRVDYAGPVQIRTTKGRGHKSHKGYIVVFVCLTSKAVHLDAVTDLTSAAFVAAFHRFVARRGRCSSLLSDNGTTFKEADVVLKEMFQEASQFYATVSEELANDGTQWSFMPPYLPHMGSLWEAAVKSVKKHLQRVIGETTLTYEEMATLLCRVEACLHSRPLTPLSDDPLDTCPLTPGWTSEYLQQLQQRPKWQRQRENVQIDTLVLVADELTPPTRWPLAHVTDAHPGHDGLVRVVTLRSGARTFRRTIAKVVLLPIYEDNGRIQDR